MLADVPDHPPLCPNEQRNAVRGRLHDRSQDQAVLRLWTHIAGDRALARHGERGTARGHGAVAGADESGWTCVHREIAGTHLRSARIWRCAMIRFLLVLVMLACTAGAVVAYGDSDQIARAS